MTTPLSAAQLAQALGVTVATVHDWAVRGVIPCSQVGRRRWFVLDEVLDATKRPARAMVRMPTLTPHQQQNDGLDAVYAYIGKPRKVGR